MSIEGKIKINVITKLGKVQAVSITSSRPLSITQLFKDKNLDSIPDLMNAVYQLCNIAHRFSFLSLLNKTTVINLSQNEVSAYKLLLDLESIREHCFSIYTKWNQDSINRNLINLLDTLKKIKSSLFPNSDALSIKDKELQAFNSIEKLVLKLENQLEALLIGSQFRYSSVFANFESFNNWLNSSKSISANFLNYLKQHQLEHLGDVEVFLLPEINLDKISLLLDDINFIKNPTYQNTIFETTPYSRQIHHPLIKQLYAIYGNGLFTRSVAKLVEIFELFNRVKHSYTNIKFEKISYNTHNNSAKLTALTQVEAARGKLIHKICIKNDKVNSYQILAPTEWNFHPKGILNRMIKSIYYTDKQDLINKIRLLVDAIDPCVGYEIEVSDA